MKLESVVQQEKIKHLLNLIQENPNLPIVPMVDSEVVSGDDYSSWMGGWGNSSIDEYWHDNDKINFKSSEYEDLVEKVIDENSDDEWKGMSDEMMEQRAAEIVSRYEWVKCITVEITTPD